MRCTVWPVAFGVLGLCWLRRSWGCRTRPDRTWPHSSAPTSTTWQSPPSQTRNTVRRPRPALEPSRRSPCQRRGADFRRGPCGGSRPAPRFSRPSRGLPNHSLPLAGRPACRLSDPRPRRWCQASGDHLDHGGRLEHHRRLLVRSRPEQRSDRLRLPEVGDHHDVSLTSWWKRQPRHP